MRAPESDGIVWRKSSYSTTNGGCVEVGWRKSSYSTSNGDCVEVNRSTDDVLVRDTKNRPGPTLTFPAATWRTFLHRTP